MTEINVVQLARFNTTNAASNTEWITTLKQPVVLNQGDTAVVSKAYLDTRLNTGGNIVIPADLPLSITMYYYMMFPPDGTSLNKTDGTPPVDLPDTPAAAPGNPTIFPPNAPPAQPATSSLNPCDLKLFVANFQNAVTGNWEQYQLGSTPSFNPGIPTNDGVPIPPYTKFNSPPLYTYTYNPDDFASNYVNQCWAGELPLLLVTSPISGGFAKSIPFTKVWNYTLKAGSYSPDQLAEIITRAMSGISPGGLGAAGTSLTNNYDAYSQFGTNTEGSNGKNAFLAKGQQVAIYNDQTDAPLPTPIKGYQDDVWTTGMLYNSNDPSFISQNSGSQANCILASFVKGCDIPNEYLDFNNNTTQDSITNPLCFQQLKYQAGYSVVTVEGNGAPIPQPPPAPPLPGPNYPSIGLGIIDYTSPVIGCPQPELLYNDLAGVFQWGYTHTPLLELPTGGGVPGQNTGTNPIEVVKIIKTINIGFIPPAPANNYFDPVTSKVNITEHTKHSGVLFKSLEPASFWQGILGFDLNAITFTQDEVWGANRTIDYPKFFNATTSGFVGLSNNFNYNNIGSNTDNLNQPPYLGPVPLYPTKSGTTQEGTGELTYTNLLNSARWFGEQYILQNNSIAGRDPRSFEPYLDPLDFPYATFFPYFYEEYASALTATNPISAISPPLSNVENVGHYLVEIIAYGGDKEFINTNTVYQIKNIISSYYSSSGNFQSSPFPDSYVYTHTGETQIIHFFKIRILDPYTMDTATNIGPSSSVYVQFNKALTPVALAQPS